MQLRRFGAILPAERQINGGEKLSLLAELRVQR